LFVISIVVILRKICSNILWCIDL